LSGWSNCRPRSEAYSPGDIETFAATRDRLALLAVLPTGIVFGAAHALTPGHSKSVLAAYAAGSDLSRIRIVATALVLTLTHVGMAVLLAVVANTLVTRTIAGAGRAPALEFISHALLISIGIWLLARAAWGRRRFHGEAIATGVIAGLIPCPLTLFLMFYATSKGVPEAGLTFALAMVMGVGLVLVAVAVTSVLAREALVKVMTRYRIGIDGMVRVIDGLAGIALMILAVASLIP
jgi:ABC-type nickel/cobalt efflux system permease component RcnA